MMMLETQKAVVAVGVGTDLLAGEGETVLKVAPVPRNSSRRHHLLKKDTEDAQTTAR